MERSELIEYILQSSMFRKWHWFSYHFNYYNFGCEHPFAKSIIDSCVTCDEEIPGYAKKFVDRIISINGGEKDYSQYEQLIQALSELLIIKRTLSYDWPNLQKFCYEPTNEDSKKNPEIQVEFDQKTVGIEVKCPSWLKHIQHREASSFQLPYRGVYGRLDQLKETHKDILLPRDNTVKDCLISADQKFQHFKEDDKQYYGILVIVWDTMVFEMLQPLVNVASGLFTPNNYVRNSDGSTNIFPNVDEVIIVPHRSNITNAAGDWDLHPGFSDAFDYGRENQYPFKIFVKNPNGQSPPPDVEKCFYAVDYDAPLGAEYQRLDWVQWIDLPRTKHMRR